MTSSPWQRTLRAAVGLITIWCLGCSSFDQIVGSMTDACVDDDTEVLAVGVPEVAETPGDAGDTPSAAMSAHGASYDCGCHNGHVATLTHLAFASPLPALPTSPQVTQSRLVSVSRAPTPPPPEAAT